MDKRDLFYSCKTGNLSRISYLVEDKDVDLNAKDRWDGTPLYYACLCGHYNVVLYLLKNGATCDANTFDGERCLYGALTDDIRHLLENFKVITSVTIKRDKYSEFLRRAFENSDFSDIEFHVENENILAHRVILAARSKFCLQHFISTWKDKITIDLTYLKAFPGVLRNFLQCIYMGQACITKSEIGAFTSLSNHFMMYYLTDEVEKLSFSKKNSVLYIQPKHHPQVDYLKLFQSTLPIQFRTKGAFEEPQFVDIKIKVGHYVFPCHKVFICGRCCYLQALVTDHFSETLQSKDDIVQIISVHDIEPEIFIQILKYIYTDTADLSPENVLTVLAYADKFMLPGLKKICSSFTQQHLTVDDVIPVLKLARLYELSRLEDKCAEYMAEHLEEVICNQSFEELVLSDAQEIKNRQETDTIPIIDDIRYHINSSSQVKNEFKKHVLINDLLDILNLEA